MVVKFNMQVVTSVSIIRLFKGSAVKMGEGGKSVVDTKAEKEKMFYVLPLIWDWN